MLEIVVAILEPVRAGIRFVFKIASLCNNILTLAPLGLPLLPPFILLFVSSGSISFVEALQRSILRSCLSDASPTSQNSKADEKKEEMWKRKTPKVVLDKIQYHDTFSPRAGTIESSKGDLIAPLTSFYAATTVGSEDWGLISS